MDRHDIRSISAAETRPLRQAVLRPHQRIAELVYTADDDPETLHVGAFHEGRLVGIATVLRQPCPRAAFVEPWQLEGVATMPEVRGLGYGRAILTRCIAYVAGRGGATLWCNGRTSATGFYVALGFRTIGEEFITATGPHYVFFRLVDAAEAN